MLIVIYFTSGLGRPEAWSPTRPGSGGWCSPPTHSPPVPGPDHDLDYQDDLDDQDNLDDQDDLNDQDDMDDLDDQDDLDNQGDLDDLDDLADLDDQK